MRFPPSFLDEVKARTPLSSVVGRRLRWDQRKSRPGQGDYWACCPFHQEKTASFHCDDEKGFYFCFGCQRKGDVFTFLVEKDGLSFTDAVLLLADQAGLKPPVPTADGERRDARDGLYDLMEQAAGFFAQRLQKSEGAPARDFLRRRGIDARMTETFGLGYAPDGRHGLKGYLAEQGATPAQMALTGLVVTGEDIAVPYDRFRHRLMFPIHDARGRVVAFGGRALAREARAKYINSPEGPLFHKGQLLFNAHRARRAVRETGQLIVAEGYTDVIAMTAAGIANAVASLGTALTDRQLGLLWRMADEPVLCFDGDEAGFRAAHKALELALPQLQPGKSLRFALLPAGQDPDDVISASGPEALKEIIAAALPLIDVLWRRALEENSRATPEARAKFELDLERNTERIADNKVKAHYRSALRERLTALWRQTPGRAQASYRSGSPPSGYGWRSRREAEPAWRRQDSVSAELRASMGGADAAFIRARQRRERLMLATLINHPTLLEEDAEAVAECAFSAGTLDRLRREILDVVSAYDPGEAQDSGGFPDSAALRARLKAAGLAGALADIDAQAQRLAVWFATPQAAISDARTGFRQMLALHHKSVTLLAELTQAERRLAADPSEDALRHLNGVREALRSADGEEAAIEGFGHDSGREVKPVTCNEKP